MVQRLQSKTTNDYACMAGPAPKLGIYQPVSLPPKLVQVNLSVPIPVQQIDHALRIIPPDGIAQLSAAGCAAIRFAKQDALPYLTLTLNPCRHAGAERPLVCCSAAHVP